MRYDIPAGGCVKMTDGTYVQVFNMAGELVQSLFIAGDVVTYEDEDGKLPSDDVRLNFYAPFGTDEAFWES